ncbi:MAG: hypothetical protein HYU66_27730 [Armatimonadetes bacterium]|nr:hypothetical protein [Armatimonadota bacterium]
MLEAVDLAAKLSREEYQAAMSGTQSLLNALRHQHQRCIVGKVPVAVVLEGWDAAGKGTMVSRIVERLDPRWFKVIPISAPLEEERLRPFLWRFWMSLPRYGHWGIYDRSWYGRVLVERVDQLITPDQAQDALREIVEFERQLTADGMVICKFFLHITKKEQRKRFRACEKDPYLAWKVQPEDWRHHKQYEIYVEAIEEMLAHTSRAHAPWTIVESTCARWAQVKVFRTICESVAAVLDRRGVADPELAEQEDPDDATPPAAPPEPEAEAAAAASEPVAAGGDQ